jgi:prepilin-type N-terminal cleavage/methylation domain-containing protein
MAVTLLTSNALKSAFTLFEMLIVLLITSITIMIGYAGFKNAQSANNEKTFFKRFDMNWKDMQRLTAYDGYKATVTFYKKGHEVIFLCYKSGSKVAKYLEMPDDLEPVTDRTINIGKNGLVKPISVVLASHGKNKYKLSAQLGWGVYEITRK